MRREHRRPRIWRSAFVAADGILQLAISRSDLRAICFHISAVIRMFLTFSFISFRARWLWHSVNAAAET